MSILTRMKNYYLKADPAEKSIVLLNSKQEDPDLLDWFNGSI